MAAVGLQHEPCSAAAAAAKYHVLIFMLLLLLSCTYAHAAVIAATHAQVLDASRLVRPRQAAAATPVAVCRQR